MHEDLIQPYASSELPAIQLGGIKLNEDLLPQGDVHLVLKSFNRHGLIAGATGSGKTKTMQVLAEQLSLQGVPSFLMDIKGDVSGLAMPGETNDKLINRSQSLGLDFKPQAFPVEFFTLNPKDPGVPLRATVSDFGPLLFARMLDLNETQAGVVTILFEFAKAKEWPLLDLADFKSLLQYVQTEAGKQAIESQYGAVASTSVGTIVRKVIELESQGGNAFFAEPPFNPMDLLRTNAAGLGIISVLRLLDMQDKPKLFSTFMLKLLSDIYRQMPELGDPDKPRLVIFIDEAHLIFNQASKALLDLLETMVKLIRSKGVGLIFCTQTPDDIPEAVLSQLGLKIQHALRAFTAKDRKTMKLVAQNFPLSDYYDTETLLTALGIGDALICALDSKGQPTPLIECRIRAPESRMGILTDQELQQISQQSTLMAKYGQVINRRSAKEMIAEQQQVSPEVPAPAPQPTAGKVDPNVLEKLSKNTLIRQLIRDFFRFLTKNLFGKR